MPFESVEQFGDVRGVAADHGDTDARATMQVAMIGLGDRHVVSATDLGDDRADDRSLLLEGVDVAEQEIEF
ncbi:hypothetical protein GCM10023197_24440 [Gordonia humi]|uniref:Uncharacterized protein n=1 Tax=Gordonia humi TaxID=686429 RepID=A0A840EXS4_9ACTN|nr:hypothetical protein [Gordonia humi]